MTAPAPPAPCVVFIGGTGNNWDDAALNAAAGETGVYLPSYGGSLGWDLGSEAIDSYNANVNTPGCPAACQRLALDLNMLQQANPQGLVLVPWSGGAIPLNQAAGSGQLSTAGINGIIYMSPGNPGGFSKTLQDIPTFTYWGNGNTNTAVYNSNSLMFDGVAVDLPPGGSATILGCDHNFGCSWNSGEVPHPPSDCKRNTSALTKHEKGLEQEHPPSLLDVVEAEVAYAPPDVSYLGSVPDVGDLDRETYEGKLN